jgi:hypothetical protein
MNLFARWNNGYLIGLTLVTQPGLQPIYYKLSNWTNLPGETPVFLWVVLPVLQPVEQPKHIELSEYTTPVV